MHWKNNYLFLNAAFKCLSYSKKNLNVLWLLDGSFLTSSLHGTTPRLRTRVESQGHVRAGSDWALRTLEPLVSGATSVRPWLEESLFLTNGSTLLID